MIEITFESPSETNDDLDNKDSGHFDSELSSAGLMQAREMGERYKDELFDFIFCSDLQRSFDTAQTAFGDRGIDIIEDKRLRGCDLGKLTRALKPEVEKQKLERVKTPFPEGESYEQVVFRVKDFLRSILHDYNGKKLLIVGHEGTRIALEFLINNQPLEKALSAKTPWQPGWKYALEKV